MSRGLTPNERALWNQTTKNVTPFRAASTDAPAGPVTGHQFARVSAPRSIEYDPVVDLHGVTVHEAHGMVLDHVQTGAMLGYKRLTVITGRSGQINQEMPRWLEGRPVVRSVTSMNGGGAWEICLFKRNT